MSFVVDPMTRTEQSGTVSGPATVTKEGNSRHNVYWVSGWKVDPASVLIHFLTSTS
jgi:hypothetical protein